jgi:hypothetical protein
MAGGGGHFPARQAFVAAVTFSFLNISHALRVAADRTLEYAKQY